MTGSRYLNIGCGSTFHPAWTNVDLASASPHVQVHDIRSGLPYSSESFDACYHSHVLEHVTREQAERLISECFRVLAPGGVLRVAVPDLEVIARNYLRSLERASAVEPGAEHDYDWTMLELYDQTVRSKSGGGMVAYLMDPAIPNREFVHGRLGAEAEAVWTVRPPLPLWERVRRQRPSRVVNRIRLAFTTALVRILAGQEAQQAFREGIFRNSGEIHRWMYDRFSLGRLLTRAGFVEVRVCRADESRIPGFNDFRLDMTDRGVRKPDSLFIEGRKP